MKIVKRSIMILSLLLFIFVLIMPSAYAVRGGAGRGKVTYRPLSDWLDNNPPTFDYISSLDDPTSYFAITHEHTSALDPFSLLPDGVIGTTETEGYVKERVLPDGRAEITAYVYTQNAPLTIYNYDDMTDWAGASYPSGALPTAILGSGNDGFIDYSAWYKLILPAPGQEIPYFLAGDLVATCIAASGYGTFTNYAADFGFTPGTQGIVQIIQTGLFAAASKADLRGALADGWPVELVSIHQLY